MGAFVGLALLIGAPPAQAQDGTSTEAALRARLDERMAGHAMRLGRLELAEAYLEKSGKYIVKCDIHPWMNAYVHAVSHPYFAITDAKGKFVKDFVKAWNKVMELDRFDLK